MNFFCLLGLLAEGYSKTSLLQLLYVGGYTNLSENCNNSTRSPVPFGSVLGLQLL